MQPLANVLLTTLAILILNANQNVWSTQNAPETRLVSVRSAETLVLVFAVHLLTAQQRTTTPPHHSHGAHTPGATSTPI